MMLSVNALFTCSVPRLKPKILVDGKIPNAEVMKLTQCPPRDASQEQEMGLETRLQHRAGVHQQVRTGQGQVWVQLQHS